MQSKSFVAIEGRERDSESTTLGKDNEGRDGQLTVLEMFCQWRREGLTMDVGSNLVVGQGAEDCTEQSSLGGI